jgi:hypothetical protein
MATSSDFQDYVSSATKWAYWIIGIVIIFTVSNVLYNRMNKQIAALLVFLAGAMALYYYYVKWFIVSGMKWPPVSSMCPDFLTTVYAEGSGSTKTVYCMDLGANASKDGRFPTSTSIPDNVPKYYEEEGGARNVLKISNDMINTTAKIRSFCTNIEAKGLTWASMCEEE